MATAAEPTVTNAHHDDVEIVEQLAKLQQMHQQIHDLRSLLPNALIGPAREAISQPRKAHPTQIAVSIINAAQKGKQDIQSFRQDWQAENTRQLFKDANAANTPQGGDTWQMDYRVLAKAAGGAAPTDSQDQLIPFEAIEEAKAAFENFNKHERKIKLQASDPSSLFPIDVELNRTHFRILREEASDAYRVEPVTGGSLPQQLVGQFAQGSSLKQLGRLLPHLEAYHDIRIRKCDKCTRLLDSDLNLPLVRKSTTDQSSEDTAGKWLAYHRPCVP